MFSMILGVAERGNAQRPASADSSRTSAACGRGLALPRAVRMVCGCSADRDRRGRLYFGAQCFQFSLQRIELRPGENWRSSSLPWSSPVSMGLASDAFQMVHQQQHNDDDGHQPRPPLGPYPAAAMRPCGKGADQHQDQYNQQYGSSMFVS